MKNIWEYIKEEGKIRILKVYGDGGCVILPEMIDGCPVTEVGPYAFSAAPLPGRFQPKSRIYRSEEQRGGRGDSAVYEKICGERLETVILPETIAVIGDYAFYGCRSLRKISFTDSLKRIGSGAFMGCDHVREFVYKKRQEGKDSLYRMLSELRYAIDVKLELPDGMVQLVFPEYYEMSVENVPARIFEVHVHGTGYRYRQCFCGGEVDYRSYDALFSLAQNQEPEEVLLKLALGRLKFPVELSEKAKKEYLDYFSHHARTVGELLLKADDLEAITLICQKGGFDGETEKENRFREAAVLADRRTSADGAGDFYMASLGESVLEVGQRADGPERLKENEQEEAEKAGGEKALDVLIDLAGRMGRTECLSFLMDYHHKKQKNTEKKKVFDL